MNKKAPYTFGGKIPISWECPTSVYMKNVRTIDYLLIITSEGYDRSNVNYLASIAALDTTSIINKLNKEESDKKKKKKKGEHTL